MTKKFQWTCKGSKTKMTFGKEMYMALIVIILIKNTKVYMVRKIKVEI